MGNCTSKKSRKSLKLGAANKPLFLSKMDKDQDTHIKGLSKKVAPFTKGEVTSFGFKKKLNSQLPVPVTLTSNGRPFQETNEKMVQNGGGAVAHKNLSEGYQSGSSVESLCHAPFRSTPKMIRKKDVAKQQIVPADETQPNSINAHNAKNIKTTFHGVPTSLALSNENNGNVFRGNSETVNRFGFRQPTPPRATENVGKRHNGVAQARAAFLASQDSCETGNKKSEISARSRSEGPREAFFRQNLQPANSVQSGLNQSRTSLANGLQPGKFTLQTSHLPRPQFPVRMSDTKTAKTATNYYRRGGVQSDSNSSKEGSLNEDSGFESHASANNTLEKTHIEILESSPGSKVRRRLPAFKGKKLEMKIVGNKFELLKKDEENSPDVVTEISLIKLPASNIRTSTAIINTGLVEQRASQYLKKISQPYNNKKSSDVGLKDPNRLPLKSNVSVETPESNYGDEGLGAESEEEKLFKDSKKSEKTYEKYLMSDGSGDGDDMLPGEAMAEDVSLCLSFEEEASSTRTKKVPQRATYQPDVDVTPNTIRLDALKLSKQLKYKNCGSNRKGEESALDVLMACEKDEDTFPSDSILEQLSSCSDSLGDKGENKNNDKEKNLKTVDLNLDKEDLGIDMDEEENNSKSDTDVDENDLELNIDETEVKDENKNCLGSSSPDSPGTPTHASNSLSLSDGRDFLIDDEIADQPQLCLSESYVDCSCQEEVKTTNEKTMTSVNNDFVTCSEFKTNTLRVEDEGEKIAENGEEVEKAETETFVKAVIREESYKRRNSEGTLSPCESIASDDLMLDFELNSFEETAGRFDNVNDNISVGNSNTSLNRDPCQRQTAESGCGKSLRGRDVGSNCSTPASIRNTEMVSRVVSSPFRSSRSTPADDDSVKLDKNSYQNMFQDVVSMKAMLLRLKRLLMESEGGLQENGRIYPEDGTMDNLMEDELSDLRRQVLFLQQQLEEREKTVQTLRLEITKASESGTTAGTTDSRKQSNAATQTGLDQFQQDFPHFRIFQTTPVV